MKKVLTIGLIIILSTTLMACSSNNDKKKLDSEIDKKIEEYDSDINEKTVTKESTNIGEDSSNKIPDFRAIDFEENDVTAKDIFSQNDLTIINMWFTGCPPCVQEMPHLADMDREFKLRSDKKVGIVGICTDLDYKNGATVRALEITDSANVDYPNLIVDLSDEDTFNFIASFQAYPTTFFVDKDGNIIGEPVIGAILSQSQIDDFMEIVNNLLKEIN